MGTASAQRPPSGLHGVPQQTLPTTEPDTRHTSSKGVMGKLVFQVIQGASGWVFLYPKICCSGSLQLNEGLRNWVLMTCLGL